MDQYIDKVGSLEKDDLSNFGSVKDFIKGEVNTHEDLIAEKTENAVSFSMICTFLHTDR